MSFLKPKNEVIYIYDDTSVKAALEEMEKYRFASIPMIDREGRYVGTITEGDFLWEIKKLSDFNLKKAESLLSGAIHRHRDYVPVKLNANMDDLILKAADQNFVPIIDDAGVLVGIVTRKMILNYFFDHKFIVL
jgi:CBS domain-containing protein